MSQEPEAAEQMSKHVLGKRGVERALDELHATVR
jgi:hypothetical protein